ncbi:MAG TPA: tRNA uracil 4-sulfurtransferase ThiI [Candidatus Acidoferrum sp.]|nr:tRNA uracil 4-sulfurtransferase ThiI [Candidatus Acidoferrum sp.]
MKRYDAIVVHFGELWLKGRNRSKFIARLRKNIEVALHESRPKVSDERDRFLLYFKDQKSLNNALDALRFVFGISWFAPVVISKNTLQSIVTSSKGIVPKSVTVRIVASRSNKSTKFNSYEIVSEFIKRSKSLGFKIDKDSEKELLINVMKDGTLICSEKMRGLGGLPVGSSGKAVSLLSGGIDSPVASFYAMKRGLELVYLHMHAFNNNKEARSSKMSELLKILSRYNQKSPVYYAPAYVFQSATLKTPRKYELVLFRRFLYVLASSVAEKEGATAIVTGESLGQVASQTVGNMTASQHGIEPIIIRPLIGFDKHEIISMAKELGTFNISIKSYKDVCSIGVRNPSTNMSSKLVSALYKECDLDSALRRTVKLMENLK